MLGGVRILVVDDAPDMRALLKALLTRSGATVTEVSDGRQAVDSALESLAKSEEYDVILMDVEMPVMDGVAATELLRSRRYDGTVVLMSAHATGVERDRAEASGCDGFLVKPIRPDALIRSVLDVLARERAPTFDR